MLVLLYYSSNITYIDNKTKMSSQKNFINDTIIEDIDNNMMIDEDDNTIMEDTNNNTMIDEDDDDNPVDINRDKNNVIENLTQEYSIAITMGTYISDKTVGKMRAMYLKNIKKQNWMDFFCEFGKKLMAKLENLDEDDKPLDNTPYSIGMDGKTYELAKTIITIGRYEKCDIVINRKNTASSRLNAIVFVQPSRVIIIDPGSFRGVRTIMRQNEDKPLEHSRPHRRKPLVFGRTEKFVLKLGINLSVSFSPKICIVCMERPREILQVCGHYCMCRFCFLKFKRTSMKCPICKENISNGELTHQFKTYVVQKSD